MRKQTVLLLIILLGAFSAFLFVARGRATSFQGLMAQIGITVGVAPNPYNTLNDQLNQEASDLAAREAALASSTASPASAPRTDWRLAAAIAFIALLVILNFFLDWRRSRSIPASAPPLPGDREIPKE